MLQVKKRENKGFEKGSWELLLKVFYSLPFLVRPRQHKAREKLSAQHENKETKLFIYFSPISAASFVFLLCRFQTRSINWKWNSDYTLTYNSSSLHCTSASCLFSLAVKRRWAEFQETKRRKALSRTLMLVGSRWQVTPGRKVFSPVW